MTVAEAVKAYRLESFEKSYEDVLGMSVNLIPLDTLIDLRVKSVHINLQMKVATISVIYYK